MLKIMARTKETMKQEPRKGRLMPKYSDIHKEETLKAAVSYNFSVMQTPPMRPAAIPAMNWKV